MRRGAPGKAIRAAALAAAGLLCAAPALATGPDPALRSAAARAEAAGSRISTALEAIPPIGAGPRARREALVDAARAFEEGMAAARLGLRLLSLRREALQTRIAAGEAETETAIALLLGMERTPAPAVLVNPAGPLGHLRAGHALAALGPALQARAAGLLALQEEAARLDAALADLTDRLRAGLIAVQTARAVQTEALRDRDAEAAPISAAARRSMRAAAAAMAELGALLEEDPLPPAPAAAPPAWGALPLPLTGRIAEGYGAPDADGAPLEGLRIAASPLAPVIAPFDAVLRFAGPMEGYGQVAILEPAPGRLLVLAGLGPILPQQGELVKSGRILARLGAASQDAPEFLIEADAPEGARSDEILYLEVRENGEPVDPAGWFALEQK